MEISRPAWATEGGALAATAEALVLFLAPRNQHKEHALRIRSSRSSLTT